MTLNAYDIRGRNGVVAHLTAEQAREHVQKAAMEYAAKGWPVVLVHGVKPDGSCSCAKGGNCRSAGKHPILPKWQDAATTDEDAVLSQLEDHPYARLGILLGPKSGVFDIEYNKPEGEEIIAMVFDGEIPITPSFHATRGRHWLFRHRPGLPPKARYFIGGGAVEVLPGNQPAQVVVPPVYFPYDKQRLWISGCSPAELDVAEISDAALARLVNWDDMSAEDIKNGGVEGGNGKPKRDWPRLLAGVPKTVRNNSACQVLGKMITRHNLEDPDDVELLHQWFIGWNRGNSEPLEEKELDDVWKSILNRAVKNSVRGKASIVRDAAGIPHGWRVIIVNAEPPMYKLFSPFYDGFIVLDPAQFLRWDSIRVAALTQKKRCWLPASFSDVWQGCKETKAKTAKPAFAQELLDDAEEEDAPLELMRGATLQERIRDWSAGLSVATESLDVQKLPGIAADGKAYFVFGQLLGALNASRVPEDKVTRKELTEALRDMGVQNDSLGRGNHKRAVKVLPQEALAGGARLRKYGEV